MVVVKVELWPGGDESQARMIGVAKIVNDNTGDDRTGNYNVELSHSGKYFGRPGVWKRGRVTDYPRMLSPYNLVFAALKSALGFR